MESTITLKNIAEEIIGRVMVQDLRNAPAPSNEATSYSSRGTFLSAARKITIVPLTAHNDISTIDGLIQSGSTSHCGPEIPNGRRNSLMAPVLPFSSRRKTAAVASIGVIFGR